LTRTARLISGEIKPALCGIESSCLRRNAHRQMQWPDLRKGLLRGLPTRRLGQRPLCRTECVRRQCIRAGYRLETAGYREFDLLVSGAYTHRHRGRLGRFRRKGFAIQTDGGQGLSRIFPLGFRRDSADRDRPSRQRDGFQQDFHKYQGRFVEWFGRFLWAVHGTVFAWFDVFFVLKRFQFELGAVKGRPENCAFDWKE
jgi:hypothetical protein